MTRTTFDNKSSRIGSGSRAAKIAIYLLIALAIICVRGCKVHKQVQQQVNRPLMYKYNMKHF